MILDKVVRRFRIYREQGLVRSARIVFDLISLSILRAFFGFNPWHARSPASLREYRKGLAVLVNGLKPRCVVEVGCGLGAILSRVEAAARTGYDTDRGAIRAARFLNGRSVRFVEGGFDNVTEPVIDVLIAVNWPHDFSPDQLERWIVPLLPRVKFLLVDKVDATSPSTYRHYHDFAFLNGLATPTRVESFGERHRRFFLYQVNT